jgi:tetratricopeptide (TPR) repeat protein
MRILLIALTLAAATTCAACLWDYDTLAQESAGLPDVKAVIAGGFPRNPPLYYEMRLERVTKLLADNPDDLDAYDAAAVSCDRLGRSDEAIEWMAKKLAAMDRMGYDSAAHEQPNHRYRYLANLGTFHAHRWFKNGANREDMADMERGRDLIKQAIEENPNAHFGREKYQLMIMDWVIALRPFDEPVTHEDGTAYPRHELPLCLGVDRRELWRVRDDDSQLDKLGLTGAIDGLSGLITMGAAWESVDVFHALAAAIQITGRSSLAVLAMERCRELIKAGKTSVVPNAPTGEELFALISKPDDDRALYGHLIKDGTGQIDSAYKQLRNDADTWHQNRTKHMLAQLQKGLHPDTHSDFWSGFDGNPDRMEIPEQGSLARAADGFFTWFRTHPFGPIGLVAFLIFSLAAAIGFVLVRRSVRARTRRRFSGIATAPEP